MRMANGGIGRKGAKLNDTGYIRSKLQGRTDAFTASEFSHIKSVASVMNKMHRRGEIMIVGVAGYAKSSKPVNVYKVINLKQKKEKVEKQASSRPVLVCREIPVFNTLWGKVYPDLFTNPDFSGYSMTKRGNIMGI